MGIPERIVKIKLKVRFLMGDYEMKIYDKISMVVIVLSFASMAFSADVTFSASGSIGSGETYDTVYLENDGTIVNMTGGQITNLSTIDASTFDFSGGQISGLSSDVDIAPLGNFNMTNGTADLFGFYLESAGATYSSGGMASITGGVMSADNVKVYDGAILTLNNANINFDTFDVLQGGQVDIFGGDVDIASAYVAYGYYIGDDYMDVGSTINIYGYGFNYNSTTEILSGYLQDENYFQIGGVNELEYTSFNLIPEPTSILLLGLGGMFLRRIK